MRNEAWYILQKHIILKQCNKTMTHDHVHLSDLHDLSCSKNCPLPPNSWLSRCHPLISKLCMWVNNKGHFTHEPRSATIKLWEPKRKCPKAVPRHLQNHVMWTRTLKCSVKPYVTGSSNKCYFLFMRICTHDKIDGCKCSECHGVLILC